MSDRARAGRWLAPAALALLPWLAPACGPATVRATSSGAAGLANGPTRWLMLADELKQSQRLRTTREAVDFVESFWRRRDPDPEPGNPFAKTFYERVEAADRLDAEAGEPGRLSHRGPVPTQAVPPRPT